MWKCKKCGEENEDTFDSCWSCGTSLDGIQSVDIKEFKSLKEKEDVVKIDNVNDYTTTYGTTRMVAQFVSLVGWVVVAISIVILLVSILVSIAKGSRDSFAMMGIVPSLAGVISGLLLVIAGQMTRATVDTADNTGNMLAIMKKRKWK